MKNLIPVFINDNYKKEIYKGNFSGITIFADIKGFSSMTEELMKNGKEGAEILAVLINKMFSPAIENIYNYGGFTAEFAGDAFTSVFPYENNQDSVIRALKSAEKIKDFFISNGNLKTRFGNYNISVKMGISFGNIEWEIIKTGSKDIYYFKGNALEKACLNEKNSGINEITADNQIINMINLSSEEAEIKTGKDNLYKIIKIKSDIEDINNFRFTDLEVQNNFFDEILSTTDLKGEFRDVVTCFISFKKESNQNEKIEFISETVKEYGGYLNRISFIDKGFAALVVFGAPSAVENVFKRASAFIISLREKFGLSFKAGISFGKAFAGFIGSTKRCEYTVLSSKVNLAVRLMGFAEWGKILTDNVFSRFAAYEIESEFIGGHFLKGFEDKIKVYDVLDLKSSESGNIYNLPLIGRKNELNILAEYINKNLSDNYFGIVYLNSELGLGKTRILSELKNRFFDCSNYFSLSCDTILRKSLNPFYSFFKKYFNISESSNGDENNKNFRLKYDQLIELLSKKGSSESIEIINDLEKSRRVFQKFLKIETDETNFTVEPKTLFETALSSMKNIFKGESLLKPVIIEIDDCSYIDHDSTEFIKFFVSGIEKFPISLICASRKYYDGTCFSFDFGRETEMMLELQSLDYEDTVQHVKTLLESDRIPDRTVDYIYSSAGGNPFYTEQLVLYLKETNYLTENLSVRDSRIELPATINSVILARIDKFSYSLKETVKTASVLGKDFYLKILDKMLSFGDFFEYIDSAERENIWKKISPLMCSFTNILIRDTVYEMQLREKLREKHRRAAEIIEYIFKDNLEDFYIDLSNHYEIAGVDEKTLEYLYKGAESAENNYQNIQALNLYNKLLTYCRSDKERIGILFKAGQLEQTIGNLEAAERRYNEAADISDKIKDYNEKSKILNHLVFLYLTKGDLNRAENILLDVYNLSKIISCKKEKIKMMINYGNLYNYKNDLDKAEKYYLDGKHLSEEIGDIDTMCSIYSNLAIIYDKKNSFDLAELYYGKQIKAAEKSNNRIELTKAYGNLGLLFLNRHKLEQAEENLNKYVLESDKNFYKQGICLGHAYLGMLNEMRYEPKKALVHYETQLKYALEMNNDYMINYAYGNLGNIYMTIGDFDKSEKSYRKMNEITEKINDVDGLVFSYINLGILFSKRNNISIAKEFLNKSLEILADYNTDDLYAFCYLQYAMIEYLLNNFEESILYLKKSQAIAKKINYIDVVFETELLNIKIQHNLNNKKEAAIEEFEKLKKKYFADSQKATINFELFLITRNEIYRKNAIKFFKAIDKTNSYYEYQQKIKIMQNITL